MTKLRRLLARSLARLTGPRYMPDIEWSGSSWTHNAFRAYEWLFGRRYGIRAEATTVLGADGSVVREFHSWEAAIAYAEAVVRAALARTLDFRRFRVLVPALASPGVPSPYLFAVAFDAVQASTFGTNRTTTHTCTGSDRLMLGHFGAVTDTATAFKYNTVDLTFINETTYPGGGHAGVSAWYLIAPATGSNTAAVTHTGSGRMSSISYTGCHQTAPIDSSAVNNNGTGSTSVSATTTVVGSGCWLVAAWSDGGATTSAGAGTTRRAQSSDTGHTVGDSNGTVGTGSQSIIMTAATASVFKAAIVSIAPVPAKSGFLALM